MKLYDYKQAPNPRRVRIFMAEKGIEIETVQINLMQLEQHSDTYKKINPLGEVPALVLEDGTCINQTNAICRYLEDIFPDNPLYGRTALERAQVEVQNHMIYMNGIVAGGEAFRNSSPNFNNRALSGPHAYAQIPELASRGLLRIDNFSRIGFLLFPKIVSRYLNSLSKSMLFSNLIFINSTTSLID